MKTDDLLEIKQLIADSFREQRIYIEGEFAQIHKEIAQLQTDVTQLQQDVSQLQKDVAKLQTDVIRLDKKIDDMATGAAETLEDVHKDNEVRFAEHRLRIARLEASKSKRVTSTL